MTALDWEDVPGQEALFGEAPEPVEPLSAGARLTKRQHDLVASGVHPLTKTAARPDLGTCGTCVHRVMQHGGASNYPKCDLSPMSRSAASDIRAWWPACDRWEAQP